MEFTKDHCREIIGTADTLLIKYNSQSFKVRTELAIDIVSLKTRITNCHLSKDISAIERVQLDFQIIETDINTLIPHKLKLAIYKDLEELEGLKIGIAEERRKKAEDTSEKPK